VIELHLFPPAWGLQPSPFCLKVETYLRLAGIAYRPVPALPFRAPKGKLPVIVDGDRKIADSSLIIAHLESSLGQPLDRGLTADQQALAHLIRRTCEESLYFVLLYARWVEPSGWAMTRPAFFGALPPGVRDLVAAMARRGVRAGLRGQGYGWHSGPEVYALGIADIDAVAAQLAPGRFVLGERPTTIDATVYAFLFSIVAPPLDNPLKRHALGLPAVADYLRTMTAALPA